MARGKKTGGRKKGSLNKETKMILPIRDALKKLIETKQNDVEKAFDKLNPKEKVFAYTRLLPFVTPAYSAINFSLKNMTEEDLEIIINQLKKENESEEQTRLDQPD